MSTLLLRFDGWFFLRLEFCTLSKTRAKKTRDPGHVQLVAEQLEESRISRRFIVDYKANGQSRVAHYDVHLNLSFRGFTV